MKKQIIQAIEEILRELGIIQAQVIVQAPQDLSHGDYTTNIALLVAKTLEKNPHELAQNIVSALIEKKIDGIEKITVAGPGFINFTLSLHVCITHINQLLTDTEKVLRSTSLENKKIMVEYAHPNTHKEMHIGHMRTLITGEALARLFAAVGATVFRANYQGDIGLHVAKALYGMHVLLKGKDVLSLEQLTHSEKAHFLGQAYAKGSSDYDTHKEEIDTINKKLYEGHDAELSALYMHTRSWSLDYYADFYTRFYTKFDRLFFESETFADGKKIVLAYVPAVFEEQNGAIVFPGEKYGLHTRVFITGAGNPTYEGKDIGLAFMQYEAFPFDKIIHVVASEQSGYFQVVIKALSLLDPEKFANSEVHLPMGMVQLKGAKMSSRTGEVMTVDMLLDEVQKAVIDLAKHGRAAEKTKTIEQIVIGAVKYSILKSGVTQDALFDIKTSVAMDGNSGPYLQYTYARTRSILSQVPSINRTDFDFSSVNEEEKDVLRILYQYSDIVIAAAEKMSPNILAQYLYTVAQAFNLFYQKCPILKAQNNVKDFRIYITASVSFILNHGLHLLGIQTPESM